VINWGLMVLGWGRLKLEMGTDALVAIEWNLMGRPKGVGSVRENMY
jgi:hypothetical protein